MSTGNAPELHVRPAPDVLRVAPQPIRLVPLLCALARVVAYCAVLVVVFLALVALLVPGVRVVLLLRELAGGALQPVGLKALIGLGSYLAFLVVLALIGNLACKKARADYSREAVELSERLGLMELTWRRFGSTQSAVYLSGALRLLPSDRLRILIMPNCELCEVPDVPCEPLVLRATRPVPGAVIVLLPLLLLMMMLILHGRVADAQRMIWLCGMAAAPVFCYVVWTRLFKPAYVRLAPGIVQVLYYGAWGRRERVVEFPLDGDAVVIPRYVSHRPFNRFTFCDRRSRLAVTVMTGSAAQHEAVWRILHSTAPHGPLDPAAL